MARADRRCFLQASSAGLAAGLFGGGFAVADEPARPLVVGLIGCGGRGVHDADNFRRVSGVEVRYVCDPDETRRAAAAKEFGVEAGRAVGDLRRVLDDQALDAVIVATPDHWHSPAAILACDAGKHVYVEKPISHNIREGRLLVEAASRNKVLLQHGTQSRSTAMMTEAVRRLREGLIGDVLVARCWNVQRRSSIGRGRDTDPPPSLDYDTWVGPAPMIPYRTNRVHDRWTWWRHFGCGDMGNDGVHDIDYTRWGLGVETHPVKVWAAGGKLFFDDDQEFADTQQVTFEYPGDDNGRRRLLVYEQRLWSTNYPHNCDSGAEFYGTAGQMFLSRRGKIEVHSDRNRPLDVAIKPEGQDDLAHVRNFCDAVRTGGALNADALTGHLSTSLCHLGNIATLLGRSLEFDPQSETFHRGEEAAALVGRQYRHHWGTPGVG